MVFRSQIYTWELNDNYRYSVSFIQYRLIDHAYHVLRQRLHQCHEPCYKYISSKIYSALNRTETNSNWKNKIIIFSYHNCSNKVLISWSMFPNSLSTLCTNPLITLGQRRSKFSSFWWACKVEERSDEQKFWAANRLSWCAVSARCGRWEWLWRATRFNGSWHIGSTVPLQSKMESTLYLTKTQSVRIIQIIVKHTHICLSLCKSPLGSSRG